MIQTKIYCDHCGKELDEKHDYINTAVLDCDLCRDCMDKLEEIIRKFIHKEKDRT